MSVPNANPVLRSAISWSVGRFGRSLVLGIAWWANLHERIACESILMQKGDVMLEGTGRLEIPFLPKY